MVLTASIGQATAMRTRTYYPQVWDDPNQNIGEGLRHAQVPGQAREVFYLLQVRG